MRAVGLDLHRLQHGGCGAAGAQTAELVLERLRGALHPALYFVDVKTSCGHDLLPSQETGYRRHQAWRQPATTVPCPVPRRIAPIEPGSAIENTMIGSDVSRASAKAVASITL